MKKLLLIAIILWWKGSGAQDTCLPAYGLSVQKLEVAPGVRMAYVEIGKGETILFVHGLGGNLSHWLKQVASLSNTHRCIAVDLPGYGWSDKVFTTNKSQLAFYAEVLSSFIDRKGLKKVVLAGHSMGGQVAVITALRYPRKIKKLVLVAPAGLETFTKAESAMMIASTPPEVFAMQDEAAIRSSFSRNFHRQPIDAETLIQERIRLRSCPDFTSYAGAVSAGIKGMLQHPVKEDLLKIKQPVLFLFGEADALIPNQVFHPSLTKETLRQEAQTLLPQAKLVVIKEAGHLVQFEKSEETTNAIKDFLQ